MLRLAATLVVALVVAAAAPPARAQVLVTVDKTAQRLTVEVDGMTRYQWPVSTARWGYRTPNGTYRPQWLARRWFSTIYDGSPMPYSIFFNGGYAIHGSYEVSRLGRPASHGCIRLHPSNAAVLFGLVQANMKRTRIVVTGAGPERRAPVQAAPERRRAPRDRPGPDSFEEIFIPPAAYRGGMR
ncbi:MAG: L,D-transpeptidase [Pseudolabrys sp.]